MALHVTVILHTTKQIL